MLEHNEAVGLGLRRSLLNELLSSADCGADFLELAPENWIGIGGRLKRQLDQVAERYPFTLHGLSLSIGSPAKLDEGLVRSIRAFMDQYNIQFYSEHLSYCSDHGHLYDLLPIPFSEEAVNYVAKRIRRVQDILGTQIAIENVSFYAAPLQGGMKEAEFIGAVLQEADCKLLLDVNNIYVNSVNHRYDASEFLRAMPSERVAYYHVAGHYNEADDLIVDTHGADVIDPVWDLLREAYTVHGIRPTLLERDFNIPSLQHLQGELAEISSIQSIVADQPALRHGR